MGHRLTRIYTRTGDDGTTGLANGERVAKHDRRIEACGDVDETNCALGMLLAATTLPQAVRATLTRIQHELFEVGGELALPGYAGIDTAAIERLEQELDLYNSDLPPLEDFVLPGGGPAAAACHLARAVCRRAERSVWRLADAAALNPELPRYLNRLSDLLFVLARVLARSESGSEVLWQRK
jgi:cob(I)alamin adenosyltransferase